MKRLLTLLTVGAALAACDNSGSNMQGPKTQRQDTAASTAAAQCDNLQGQARDDCQRQARESGTATPSIASTPDTPVGGTSGVGAGGAGAGGSGGAAARAERGSGVEGATSAGSTTTSQQPLSTGGTTR